MEQRICPHCGKPVETTDAARFCPLCGGELPEETARAADASALEAALRERYRTYAAWSAAFLASEGPGRRLMDFFSGNSPYKTSPEHRSFFEEVKARAAELLAAYRAAPGTGDPAGFLRFALIDCHKLADKEADWMFLAAEQNYIPALELLKPEEAAALLPDYRALRRATPGFEFQRKIEKTLKKTAR